MRLGVARFTLDRVFVPERRLCTPLSFTLGHVVAPLRVAAHHRAATTATPRRHDGAGGGEDCSRNGLGMRAPLPTTDALFAHEVEQKMSNLLAGFSAAQSFLDRTQPCTEAQLEAADFSPCISKFESDLPG